MVDGSSGDAVRFEILGPVRAFRGDEPVDLGPRNQQAVLGLLLLRAGKPIAVREIVRALWNGDPPENGDDIVLRYIGALRRALDPDRTSLITFTDGGYVLHVADGAVDTGVFRAAVERARAELRTGNTAAATGEIRRALDLWRAAPLSGLTGPAFDAARAHLTTEHTHASHLLDHPAPQQTAPPPPPPRPEPAPAGPHPAPNRPEPASPASPRPTSARPEPAPTRLELPPTRLEPAPARVEPAASPPSPPAPAEPAPTRVEPAPTRIEPAETKPMRAEPAKTRIMGPEPEHPEPVDPWEGHDLFPPDPLR